MPWPCTFQDILSGIDVTIGDIPTERTHMSPDRQTLLHDLTTVVALLRGEAWVHSYHLMTSSCSLLFKDVEECAPTGVQDALGQGMVLDHVENTQFLNCNHLIVFSVLLSCLIVKITALAGDFQMRLGSITSSLAAAFTAFLPTAYLALLTSECPLRFP